jgi:putative ABC transport system substrate-binding protein
MRRRDFIAGLGAAAWPAAARAQQRVPVVGWLSLGSPSNSPSMAAFRQGLKESGFVEGQNLAIEYRWAEGQSDRLPAFAAELVRRQVNTIVAATFIPALAAKAATTTIPIVFQGGSDPVRAGLVASLNRPGGNITGVTNITVDLAAKRLDLLHKVVPNATTIAILIDPTILDFQATTTELQAAA